MKARKAELMRKYRAENPTKYAQQSREAKHRLRQRLFDVYGTKCVRCGFDDVRALTLDHVNNNGAAERAQLGERGVYRRALLPECRADYRMLCMNCQFITRHETKCETRVLSREPAVVRLAWETLSR